MPISASGRRRRRRERLDRALAIDLGSATLRIADRNRILAAVPTATAVDRKGSIVATGWDARDLLGRTSTALATSEPVVAGAVTDIDMVERLLETVLRDVGQTRRRVRTHVAVAAPVGGTALDRRALHSCIQAVLPRARIEFLEAPLAAAVGEHLEIEGPAGTMIVDVGRGRTEAAVISLGEIVAVESDSIGGRSAELVIGGHLADRHDVVVGRQRLEELAIGLCTLDVGHVVASGTRASDGRPTAVQVTVRELRDVIGVVVDSIVEVVRSALDAAPVALAADVMVRGIHLTGGASRLPGLAEQIVRRTGIEVRSSKDPSSSVIEGARRCLTTTPRSLGVLGVADQRWGPDFSETWTFPADVLSPDRTSP